MLFRYLACMFWYGFLEKIEENHMLVGYNHFRPHSSLGNKTPAEMGADQSMARLKDFAKMPERSPPTPPTSSDIPSRKAIEFSRLTLPQQPVRLPPNPSNIRGTKEADNPAYQGKDYNPRDTAE